MHKLVSITAASIMFCCSCAVYGLDTELLSDRIISLSGTIESINGELNAQRAEISSIKGKIDAYQKNQNVIKKQLLDELKNMQRQNQFIYDTLIAERENSGGKMLKPLNNYSLVTPDGKMILGAREYVYCKEPNTTIVARIDTGASTSSISANDIEEFERNGKKMVRFNIKHNDRVVTVEAPFVRDTRLRQSSTDEFSYRKVVKLNIKIGGYSTEAEFTLVDRSLMQYALLIGRNILTDVAVVDVGRQYVQQRSNKNSLLLVSLDDHLENVKNGVNINAEYDKATEKKQSGETATLARDGTDSIGSNPYEALPHVVKESKHNDNEQDSPRLNNTKETKPEKIKNKPKTDNK